MSDGWYDIAEVCISGHVSNDSARGYPDHNKPFCDLCGQQTIQSCPLCNSPLRGEYHVPGVYVRSHYRAPAFCFKCGNSLPWTVAAATAAEALAADIEGLSEEDRGILVDTIQDLVRDTAMTPVAANRFKRIMQKVGQASVESFRELLVDVVSEATKKAIWG